MIINFNLRVCFEIIWHKHNRYVNVDQLFYLRKRYNVIESIYFLKLSHQTLIKLTLTVWLIPHISTESSGSLALNNFTFWCFTRICFFFNLILDIEDDTALVV